MEDTNEELAEGIRIRLREVEARMLAAGEDAALDLTKAAHWRLHRAHRILRDKNVIQPMSGGDDDKPPVP